MHSLPELRAETCRPGFLAGLRTQKWATLDDAA